MKRKCFLLILLFLHETKSDKINLVKSFELPRKTSSSKQICTCKSNIFPGLQYLEKYGDGSSVWRSVRAEQRAERKFEQLQAKHMEQIYAKIQEDFEKQSTAEGILHTI